MVTDKGVRAGINPAPTSPPLQTDLGSETIPRNSVSRVDNVGAGFIPALTPQKI